MIRNRSVFARYDFVAVLAGTNLLGIENPIAV